MAGEIELDPKALDDGRELKRLRAVRKISLRSLAREIGISPTTLTRLERGEEPDMASARKIMPYTGRCACCGQAYSEARPVPTDEAVLSSELTKLIAEIEDTMRHKPEGAIHVDAAELRKLIAAIRPRHASDEAVEAVTVEMVDAAIAALWHEITVHPGGSIENLDIGMRDALSAALAHTRKPTVKPLEWSGDFDNTAYAKSVFGQYSGWIIGGSAYLRPPGGRGGTIVGTTADDIKRAAIENIEARILSALRTGGENG